MLSWIDELAVAFVNEVCYSPNMVTLKVEEVLFPQHVSIPALQTSLNGLARLQALMMIYVLHSAMVMRQRYFL